MVIMTIVLKDLFSTLQLSCVFKKHNWHIVKNCEKKYYLNYQGEIADYYLIVSYNENTIKFDYTLDIEVPKDKINDLLILINFVNQKTQDGFFVYDFKVNKVIFHINRQYFIKSKNEIINDVIEDNLNITKHLFYNFTLATHDLIYAEKKDYSYFELMFLRIEGCA